MNAPAQLSAFSWVPDFARGNVRDLRVRWACEEIGRPYASVLLDATHPRGPDYTSWQPFGQVPAWRDAEVQLFESGAILLYLAHKTGEFGGRDPRAHIDVLQWLMWQVGGLGPMLGQNHHFTRYAPEKVPYAIDRYLSETARLYGVLDRQLAGRSFVTGEDYTVADMACFPWILPEAQGQDIAQFPNLARWHADIAARPAVIRALARGKAVAERA